MSMDDFGNEVVAPAPRSAVERDAVAYWRGAIAKMGSDYAPQVPVADLRAIFKALAAAEQERDAVTRTANEWKVVADFHEQRAERAEAACRAALDWLNRFGEDAPFAFGGEQELADQLAAALRGGEEKP